MQYVPFLAILAAYVLIYVPRMGIVAKGMSAMPGGYNNKDPRAQQAALEGAPRRAVNAHNNMIEAFGPFAAGVIVAALRTPPKLDWLVSVLCIAFIVARSGYIYAYIADNAQLRSRLWGVGLLTTAALMVLGVIGPKL